MTKSFFFYDLETSGINPREARIMQFAGQRTDLSLQPIGKPVNCLIRLTRDVLPDPRAILITGITPQQTLEDGMSEADFLTLFTKTVATPGTIFVGYNSVRFDDEFMRHLHYRNFYDPYEWQWKDGKSRWDLLDLVRMTRALRPDGINWPVDQHGKATNRLELLTTDNNLEHEKAHDALSDVTACIAVAKLIYERQPKLFDYLLKLRDKKEVAQLVLSGQPFLYTSGKYPSEFEKTTVVTLVSPHPKHQGALVYDLRHDPTPFLDLSPEELAEVWSYDPLTKTIKLPLKTLQFNRCPAVAPLGVLDAPSQTRLQLNQEEIDKNRMILEKGVKKWIPNVLEALSLLDEKRSSHFYYDPEEVESLLYEDFFTSEDRQLMTEFRALKPENMDEFATSFHDQRLQRLVPLYIARNFPDSLSVEQTKQYQEYLKKYLLAGADKSRYARFVISIQTIAESEELTAGQRNLLEELDLWGQSILPDDVEFGE